MRVWYETLVVIISASMVMVATVALSYLAGHFVTPADAPAQVISAVAVARAMTPVADHEDMTAEEVGIRAQSTPRVEESGEEARVGGESEKPVVRNPAKKSDLVDYQEQYLSLDERTELMRLQNVVRKKHGVGPLTWTTYLAESAQGWANDLATRGCVLEHSGGPYGETIFYGRKYGDKAKQTARTPQEVINAFMDEEVFYNYTTNTCKSGKICGHYTQIVWAGSTKVGCAKSLCVADDRKEVWVCHYDPRGNIEGLKPF